MPREAAEQMRRYDAFAVMAAQCDNLGESGDPRDLYALIDSVVADMQVAMPEFACRAGCFHCCHTPPMVTSMEWRPLFKALRTLSHDKLLRVLDMVELQRSLAPALEAKRQATIHPQKGIAPPHLGMQCPLLVDGQCAVYKARTLICRAHGYFAHGRGKHYAYFGCELAKAHMASHFPQDTVLPKLEAFAAKVGQLNGNDRCTQAFLPQWLFVHVQKRTLRPMANLYPDFGA